MTEMRAPEEEFCVVMTLKRKDGRSTDLKMYEQDDPEKIAETYVRSEGLGLKSVPKLAAMMKAKRDEAMLLHSAQKDVGRESSEHKSEHEKHDKKKHKGHRGHRGHHGHGHHSNNSNSNSSSNNISQDEPVPPLSRSQDGSVVPSVASSEGDKGSSLPKQRGVAGLFLSLPDNHGGEAFDGKEQGDMNSEEDGSAEEKGQNMSTEVNTSMDYAKWIGGALTEESKTVFEQIVGSRNTGVSSPKVEEQKKSSERLHGVHASQQSRQRRLSVNMEAEKQQEVESRDFRNRRGRQSITVMSREERDAAHAQIYYDSLKRNELKERTSAKIKRDIEEKQRLEEAEYTFKPELVSSKMSPRRASVVGQMRATLPAPPSPSGASSQATGSSGDDKYDVYDWLAYHSRLESQKRFALKRVEIEKERTSSMRFRPHINSKSEVMANKKRSEKLRNFAPTLSHTSNKVEREPHAGKGIQSDNVKSLTLGDLAATPADEISEVAAAESEGESISDAGSLPAPGSAETETELFNHHQEGQLEEAVTNPSRDSSIISALDVTNPFDLVSHPPPPPVEQAPNYSPSAYVATPQTKHHLLDDDLDFADMEPAKRADVLFEYLYHGRLESEKAHADAVKKHEKHFSFKPTISSFSSSTVRSSEKADELYHRLYQTPKPSKRPLPEKKSESRRLSKEEQERMVKRLGDTNRKKYKDRRNARFAELETSILDRSSICHQAQSRRTQDLTKKARETSISEIFEVLMASVEYWRQTQSHEQEELEKKEDATKGAQQRRASDSIELHKALEARLAIERQENHATIKELEKDLFGSSPEPDTRTETGEGSDVIPPPAQAPGEDMRRRSLAEFAPEAQKELEDFVEHPGPDALRPGEPLLDTVHAQPRFLRPAALAEAMEIVMREARPEMLNREEFIDRVEVLIQSGVGPPINSILMAPRRPNRYKKTEDIEVEQHVKAPHIPSKKVSEQYSSKRLEHHKAITDPMKYSREQGLRKEHMRKMRVEMELKECTFQPTLHTEESWKVAKKGHDKTYGSVVYQRTGHISKPVLFKRESIMRPTASSKSHEATKEQMARIRTQAEGEHEHDTLQPKPTEYEYIDENKPKSAANEDSKLSDFDHTRMEIKKQHDKEHAVDSVSASHVPMFHSHKDHAAEEAIEASKKSQVPHVSDDFEKKLAETEAKIREDLANEPDLNASTASSSSSVSSSSTTMSKSTVRSSMSRMGGYLARHVSKKA